MMSQTHCVHKLVSVSGRMVYCKNYYCIWKIMFIWSHFQSVKLVKMCTNCAESISCLSSWLTPSRAFRQLWYPLFFSLVTHQCAHNNTFPGSLQGGCCVRAEKHSSDFQIIEDCFIFNQSRHNTKLWDIYLNNDLQNS